MMTPLEYSQLDSYRFGLEIHRCTTAEIDAQELLHQILDNEIDTAILRVPSNRLNQIDKIERIAMPFIVADTLIYYQGDIAKMEQRELVNQDIRFVLATPDDHHEVNQIVYETFKDYTNHYRNNPFFDNKHVNEGYQDWVRSYAENRPDRLCWLLKRDDKVIGFCNFLIKEEDRIEGILYGVTHEERGKGIFRDIMRYAINYAIAHKLPRIVGTTQIENLATQRVWAQEGMVISGSVNTIHVNAMLRKSVFDRIFTRVIAHDNDLNSPKAANRFLLKHINHILDLRQNMVTQNHRFVNIAPMQLGEEYTLLISFPMGSKGLLRVIDKNQKTYTLVYFDIRHVIA